jgi:hypothetical protein
VLCGSIILLVFQYVIFNDVVFQMTEENGEDLQILLIYSFSLLGINEPIIFFHIISPRQLL